MSWRYLCALSGWLFCQHASAYDLLLSVQGAIADNGCVVSADSQNMTVAMGDIALKQFYANDVAFGKTQFVIKLENCGVLASGVKVTFQGAANSENSELLELTQEPDTAPGLAIEILDANNARLPINTKMATAIVIKPSTSNNLVFYAQYRAVDVVDAGVANATANFLLEYQ
ncbi:fimbrial protein [Pseudomonas sp. WS 5146]|jgi:type 1 fimbria pilin|uniref:fimbrial protein n=1 Tax=Pseudomonas sp. WS 5146 TaxID=2717494 RepID=UPI001475BF76|nr:fimbrial protein [Pseudomonas sp. WS 5146]NMX56247.1 fimbrial protein [Pseudomonas sp. WS 5146]